MSLAGVLRAGVTAGIESGGGREVSRVGESFSKKGRRENEMGRDVGIGSGWDGAGFRR